MSFLYMHNAQNALLCLNVIKPNRNCMLKHLKLLQYFIFVEENLQVNNSPPCCFQDLLGFSFNLNASESDAFCMCFGEVMALPEETGLGKFKAALSAVFALSQAL